MDPEEVVEQPKEAEPLDPVYENLPFEPQDFLTQALVAEGLSGLYRIPGKYKFYSITQV